MAGNTLSVAIERLLCFIEITAFGTLQAAWTCWPARTRRSPRWIWFGSLRERRSSRESGSAPTRRPMYDSNLFGEKQIPISDYNLLIDRINVEKFQSLNFLRILELENCINRRKLILNPAECKCPGQEGDHQSLTQKRGFADRVASDQRHCLVSSDGGDVNNWAVPRGEGEEI